MNVQAPQIQTLRAEDETSWGKPVLPVKSWVAMLVLVHYKKVNVNQKHPSKTFTHRKWEPRNLLHFFYGSFSFFSGIFS